MKREITLDAERTDADYLAALDDPDLAHEYARRFGAADQSPAPYEDDRALTRARREVAARPAGVLAPAVVLFARGGRDAP